TRRSSDLGVAGLHRVVVDAAAGAGGGDAEHVVVVQHQLAEEQVVHLLHGVRGGLRLERARRGLAGEEVEGRLLVADVGKHRLADLDGDRQDGDVLALDEVRGDVTGRVGHDSDAHSLLPFPTTVAANVPQLPGTCICTRAWGVLLCSTAAGPPRSAGAGGIGARQAVVGVQVAVAQFGLARAHRDRAPVQPYLAGDVGHVQRIAAPQHQVGALAYGNGVVDFAGDPQRFR